MARLTLLRKHSILQKLLIPMLVLVALESVIFLLVFLGNNTIDQVNDNAYSVLNSEVSSRRDELQRTMVNKWANLENFESVMQECQTLYRDFLEEKRTNPDAVLQISDQVGSSLLTLLRTSSSTGAFVVIGGEAEQEGEYPAWYLRDQDPQTFSLKNDDILVEFGSSDLSKKLNLALDSFWSPRMRLDQASDNSRFYYKTVAAVKNYPQLEAKELGYWSLPFDMFGNNQKVITYTMPLIDDQGNAFGVIGIEVSVDYLYKQIPYRELTASEAEGGYIIACEGEDGTLNPLVQSGPLFKWLVSGNRPLSLSVIDEKYELYEIETESEGPTGTVLSSAASLRLYDHNTPFETEHWVLLGVVNQNDLLAVSGMLRTSILLSVGIALLLSLIGTSFVTFRVTKPIRHLASELRLSSREEQVLLPRINIAEIDNLSQAIEDMSASVIAFNSRLSYIIEATDIPIGALEYIHETRIIYCYGRIGELLCLPAECHGKTFFKKEDFEQLVSRFYSISKTYGTPEVRTTDEGEISTKIIQVSRENGEKSWLNLKKIESEAEILIVAMDITKDMNEKLKIEYERDYDVLTKLLNRRSFRRLAVRALKKESIGIGAMVMWDLDDLKYINDTYGHDCGDRYIAEAAKVLETLDSCRALVSRISGDEFLALLTGFSDKETLLQAVKTVHKRLSSTKFWLPDNQALHLRASAGLAWCPENGTNYDELARYADFAMYDSKKTMKGAIKIFDPAAFQRDALLFSGQEGLIQLFERREVRFAFQPIASVKTGEVFAYEALMRPQSDTIQTVSDVIRLSRVHSKMPQLESLTWTGALQEFRLQKEAFGEAKLFINSMPNINLSKKTRDFIYTTYHDDLYRVVLEIIESEQTDSDCMALKQRAIHAWGGEIALDDFGTGYSTETAMLALQPNYVKLDMAMIRDIDKDIARQTMVKHIVDYSRSQHIRSIAEGVETQEEMRTVVRLGVDYIQGYYLAKPELEVKDIPLEKKQQLRQAYREFVNGET